MTIETIQALNYYSYFMFSLVLVMIVWTMAIEYKRS